jgi:hypothetical protein
MAWVLWVWGLDKGKGAKLFLARKGRDRLKLLVERFERYG